MIVFIIPLKSPTVTHSWELLSKLFARTIQSVFQQTSNRFKVVVVCHKKPEINFSDPRLTYIEVDFPVPKNDRESKRKDKKLKIRVGLYYSKKYNPSHTMVVNADDCVSNKITEFTNRNLSADGWIVKRGYFYFEKSGLLYLDRKTFFRWCGTSNIIKYGLFEVPEKMDYEYLIQDKNLLKTYYNTHKTASEDLTRLGVQCQLKSLPFPGAIYMLETGENIGYINKYMIMPQNPLFWLKKQLFNYRSMNAEIREEFGI